MGYCLIVTDKQGIKVIDHVSNYKDIDTEIRMFTEKFIHAQAAIDYIEEYKKDLFIYEFNFNSNDLLEKYIKEQRNKRY